MNNKPVPSGIYWYTKPEGQTAHLFRVSGASWCSRVTISHLERPWHICAGSNTGFRACKSCLRIAQRMLKVEP